MDADDYESLPEATIATHMMAGCAAGVMEHTIMYPVDCVKTRMMTLCPDPRANYQSVYDAFKRIIQTEGPRNTLRGIEAMVAGAGPAHALYFACYEKMKSFGEQKLGNSSFVINGSAGACATVLHDGVMNPADVVKQRMQMYCSSHRTVFHCARNVYRSEGFRAFYRSYPTSLAMNIPFQSIHFMVYEKSQDYLNPSRQYNPATHIVSGAFAGGAAAAATTPLDVCKTLLNTQCSVKCGAHIENMRQAARLIYSVSGTSGFFRGISARVIHVMPSTAICWSVYEFFKYYLNKDSRDDYTMKAMTSSPIVIAQQYEKTQ